MTASLTGVGMSAAPALFRCATVSHPGVSRRNRSTSTDTGRVSVRQREAERAATAGHRVGPDAAAVGFDDRATRRQADAAARVIADAAGEHLEDVLGLGQPDAVVAYRERPARVGVRSGYLNDRRLAVVELQRVANEVLEHARQRERARADRRQLR